MCSSHAMSFFSFFFFLFSFSSADGQLVHHERAVNLREALVEALEQLDVLQHACGAAHLADRVHAQLRVPNVLRSKDGKRKEKKKKRKEKKSKTSREGKADRA